MLLLLLLLPLLLMLLALARASSKANPATTGANGQLCLFPAASSMAPKVKPVGETGTIWARNGSFLARVSGNHYGPTRRTKEEALADLHAARESATCKMDIVQNLNALVAAAKGVRAAQHREGTLPSSSATGASAPAAEQRHPLLESCAAASAAASAAEQHQQETTTAASATKLAAELLRPALSDDGEFLRRLRNRAMEAGPVAVRIVDHGSSCSTSVSSRVGAICRSLGLHTRADLSCDQPTDACGYIAADAVVCLRDAALAEADGWLTSALPEYATLATVRRGESILRRATAIVFVEENQGMYVLIHVLKSRCVLIRA